MRNALLVVAALTLVVAAWLVTRSTDRGGEGPLERSAAPIAAPVPVEPSDPDRVPPVSPVAPVSSGERRAVAGERGTQPVSVVPSPSASAVAAYVPIAVVFGQVADERGRPVVDAVVTLHSVDGRWREGVETPEIQRGPWTLHGFETRTDGDGRFRLEPPVPTAGWTSLFVESSIHLGRAVRDFGQAGGRNELPLVEGDNDLGTLTLPIAGALTGSVLDESSLAIPSAEVRLEGEHASDVSLTARCDGGGRYELAHLPPGTWEVRAYADGYLSQSVQGCAVELERTLRGPDFRLARAPTISGVVVDEAGAPLPGIAVWGWPVGSGRGAGGATDAQGRFTMHLPQDEPYRLEVDEAQFEPWGGHLAAGAVFEPGRADVRIVLKRSSLATFVVVDPGGAPVERFAIDVVELASGAGEVSSPQSVRRHEAGRVVLRARPGSHAVGVTAPGFAVLDVAVEPTALEPGGQELRLARGGSIAGQVVAAGAPVAGARVSLDGDPLPLDPSLPFDPDDWWGTNTKYDLGQVARREQVAGSDSGGAFRFDDLAPGTYRLRIHGESSAPLVLHGLVVADAGLLDLGAIATNDGATVQGRVVLAPGLSPVGLQLWIDDWEQESAIESADGRFTFEGLAPGRHRITVDARPPVLLEELALDVDLASGETREVVLDASDEAPCQVVVHVRWRDGRPGSALVVDALREDNGRIWTTGELGPCDAGGTARGVVAPHEAVRFSARSGNLPLGWSEPVVAPAGGSVETSITVASGELVLSFAPDLPPPTGAFQLQVVPLVEGVRQAPAFVRWGTPSSLFGGDSPWTGPRCAIGPVAPGTYSVRISAWSEAPPVAGPTANHVKQTQLFPQVERQIEIREGGTTVIEVPGP